MFVDVEEVEDNKVVFIIMKAIELIKKLEKCLIELNLQVDDETTDYARNNAYGHIYSAIRYLEENEDNELI